MAAVTITGSLGGQSVFFPTSTAFQTALAQQILTAAFSTPTSELVPGSGAVTSSIVLDLSKSGSVITGAASIPSVQVAMGGQFSTYVTGGAAFSTVVAADNTNTSIVNNNPFGGLVAATGAGGNVLLGLAGANNLTTGTAGQDVVFLYGSANSLTTNGSDAVLVGGPSTITAAAGGLDNVLLTSGTTLNFINGSQSSAPDSITGAANGTVVLAGTGSTSVTSAGGPETFYVDTSSGNVTLNGSRQPTDTFEFVKNHDAATGNVLVNNAAVGDTVYVHGYASYNVSAVASNPAGALLQLSDGSQVTFSNLTTAALQQAVKLA